MEQKIVLVLLGFLFFSCVNHQSANEKENEFWTSTTDSIHFKYAQGITITTRSNGFDIISKSHSDNTYYKDHLFLPFHHELEYPKLAKVVYADFEKVCCQSSTHLSFINQLNELDKVKGVCGFQYIINQEIRSKLEDNEIKELCLGESTQLETVLSIDPDIYFVYPFNATEVEDLEAKNVNTFMIGEYLENDPLARLEWIKFFGLIFNKLDDAEAYFKTTEDAYNKLKMDKIDPEKQFFMNLPYGENWDAPSVNSLIVKLINDAGLDYCFKDEVGTENIVKSKEEMWQTGAKMPYWIIIASRPLDYSLADLVAEEEVYGTFKSVQEGKVIFCNTSNSEYFTKGVLEPHIMLQEIKAAVNGDVQFAENYQYFTLLK
ncbi:ABC transporter substrate-binding protein [Paracrocinitomix mangrovi]|uniref:ABC transporter substrate-binding protein n=1 Tax=Paracrocinitomix mangrovi TaxID=2862509 RepID=UPI001C8D1542|nr:ABC transporter substrate-binding protein [Paracrocinitomix mangrovi]UKN01817.1 ABC transporter substrate-binding protein [Paracrocinitomix mangrovi]